MKDKISRSLNLIGEIFAPLIPGAVVAGLCAGFASFIAVIQPDYTQNAALSVLHSLLNLINVSLLSYLTAWIGYSAAEKFGATPVLGGMLGLITLLGDIDKISQSLGLYNGEEPLNSILCVGRGGVIAALLGAYLLSKIEGALQKRTHNSLSSILIPLFSMLISTAVYIFIIMPVAGFLSQGLCWLIEQFIMSRYLVVRIIAGAMSAALFLPLVALGMHMGLVAIYAVQLEQMGYITLYPALAMAGAGQVGACFALLFIAGDNTYLKNLIRTGIPAGICGVGQPLIYGVTLPLGKPFVTAGIGAMFGGAYVVAMQVAAATWGPSGILAVFIMTAGPNGPVHDMIHYVIGLLISAVAGFLITRLTVREKDIAGKLTGEEELT